MRKRNSVSLPTIVSKNGFDAVVFCDKERGINGATPAELLHVWQHGMFPRALAALFGQKRPSKVPPDVRRQLSIPDDQTELRI
jgi:hypothetical protein